MNKINVAIVNQFIKIAVLRIGFLRIIGLIIGCLLQQHTFAADGQNALENHERWYQVEMIIFARNETNLQTNPQQEAWPKDIKLTYPDNIVFLKPTNSNNAEGFNILAINERKLNSQAAAITKNGNYTLLFHQAWRQMIYARNTNIFISGGKTFNGHQELEGSIGLSVAQFLKIQTNLWLTQFAPRNTTPTITAPSVTQTSATPSIASTTSAENWPELPSLSSFDMNTSDQPQDYVTTRIVKISQQRSMRSIEVHYIDHPLLGIIIKIVPSNAANQ